MTRRSDLERYTTLLYSTHAQVCVRLKRWRFIDSPLSSGFAIAYASDDSGSMLTVEILFTSPLHFKI